jgi:hypothetical protein
MAQPSDEGFRVTDRRGRDPLDESAPSRPGSQPRPASLSSAEIPSGLPDARSLAGLFVMLGTEAAIALGEAPDPVTGQRQRELPHAAGIIDLLTLLREKTEGNRSTEETQVLDDLIYDLQLRYVNAAKSPG